MGKKLDKSFYQLSNETRHHINLAMAKQTDFERVMKLVITLT